MTYMIIFTYLSIEYCCEFEDKAIDIQNDRPIPENQVHIF